MPNYRKIAGAKVTAADFHLRPTAISLQLQGLGVRKHAHHVKEFAKIGLFRAAGDATNSRPSVRVIL